jgi:flagellar hook-associated protein 1 FlgK
MNNISNELTPGYKKRVVELQESGHIDGSVTGRGVLVGDVKRVTSEYMFDNLLKENGKESYYNELSTRLADVESLFFETDDSGFSNDLNRYFQALENLRSDPTNEINKNNLQNNAEIIVENIQNLYNGIDELQSVSLNTVKNDVEIINGILADIGNINEKIGQQLIPPNDLLDKRDALETQLSEYVDISVDRTDDYELKIGDAIAVRYNTNIHNVTVAEEYTPQRDKFTTDNSDNTIATAVGTLDADDVISYKLNNDITATVTFGQSITMDWNGDGTATLDTVDDNNYMRALAYEINNTIGMSEYITAYNGTTEVDADGIETETSPGAENYLNIKSSIDGTVGNFDGRILITKNTGTTVDSKSTVNKDSLSSREAIDDVKIQIFDGEISLKRGSVKAIVENLDSENSLNKFEAYQDKLDSFVSAFVDIHDSFVTQTDGSYLYGQKNVDDTTAGIATSIGLFSGATVKSFSFNQSAMTSFSQEKLDYLATLQWKSDIGFDGDIQTGTASNASSFSSFYQTVQVQIASDKENTDYLQDTQSAIVNSLEGSYDKLVKVDKDEEMINLIQFQSAYEANAKIVTVVDEMLATILGMKR